MFARSARRAARVMSFPGKSRAGLLTCLAAAFLLVFPAWTSNGQSLDPAAKKAERPRVNRAAIIPITGTINDILKQSIQRRLDKARENGVNVVVFELDTPGGLVVSALEISKMIKRLRDEDIYTVAWVHDEAYSAGALIAVACREVVMSSSASIGDCAPIMVAPGGGGMQSLGETERAKIESPILQEFRDSAQTNGYPQMLLRAMVTVGAEVWWLENTATGERVFVDAARKRALIDDLPADQREYRVLTQAVYPRSDEPRAVQQPIDREETLLTLSTDEAVLFGLASGIARDEAELAAQLDFAGVIDRQEISGWEHFALWLNSPLIRGLLFIIVIVGAYIEFQSPGLLVPGAVAGLALVAFIAAPYAAGLATYWTLILLAIGLILLAVEAFVIPGFGIAGISGLLLIALSLLATFVPAEPLQPGESPWSLPDLPATWQGIKTGIMVLSSSVIIAVVGILLLARFLPSLPGGEVLVPANPEGEEVGVAWDHATEVALVGDVGVVESPLRPGGQARFGQKVVHVSSQGQFIERGQRVRVIEHDGGRVIVRPLSDEA